MTSQGASFPEGLFASDSITRRIYSHTAVLLGWPRAILMQLAHPLVAAGVAQHSNYDEEPLQRFLHTFDAALQILFGTREQAEVAASKINAIHERVRGRLLETVGAWPAGTPYWAGDPDLLLWVHCTLVDSDLIAYERFVGPLSEREKELCYQERAAAGSLVGLQRNRMPGSHQEMQVYLCEEMASERISVGKLQRTLGHRLLFPAIRGIPKRAYMLSMSLTADLLPEKLRTGYGLSLTSGRKAASRAAGVLVRRVLPLMPARAKSFPVIRAKRIVLPATQQKRI